jgi:acetyl-CoA carboxylase biotin carboxyl carrier protein
VKKTSILHRSAHLPSGGDRILYFTHYIALNPEQEAPLDLKEIRQIIELMTRNDLSLFHLEREGFMIKLRKGVDFDTMVEKLGQSGMAPALHSKALVAPQSGIPVHPPFAENAGADASSTAPAPVGVACIVSPMVGTFYRAAGPGEKIFASVGDTVSEGTTVCIIEAMKVMNEIKAETTGVITRVLVEDATPVQFETPLFEIKPA